MSHDVLRMSVLAIVAGLAAHTLFPEPVLANTGLVTRQTNGEIVAIDLQDGAVLDVYDTAAQSLTEIAIAPDGTTFYVTNGVSNSQGPRVEFFDTDGGLFASAIVGEVPVEIAVLPDGTKAYTANWIGGSVSVVDTATQSQLKTIPTAFLTNDVAISPGGNRVYAISLRASVVFVIDTESDEIVDTIQLGTSGARHMALTPDGSKAYVNMGNVILKIDLATKVIEKRIPFDGSGGNPNNIDFDIEIDPEGTFAYANGASVVNVIDLALDDIVFQVPVALLGMRLDDVAVSPSNDFVYVTTSQNIITSPPAEIVKIRTSDFGIQDRFEIGSGALAGIALRPMLSPLDLLDDLITQVKDLELGAGTETALLIKLEGAVAKLADDNPENDDASISMLGDFIQTVDDKTDKKIDATSAAGLIEAAQTIIDMLVDA